MGISIRLEIERGPYPSRLPKPRKIKQNSRLFPPGNPPFWRSDDGVIAAPRIPPRAKPFKSKTAIAHGRARIGSHRHPVTPARDRFQRWRARHEVSHPAIAGAQRAIGDATQIPNVQAPQPRHIAQDRRASTQDSPSPRHRSILRGLRIRFGALHTIRIMQPPRRSTRAPHECSAHAA